MIKITDRDIEQVEKKFGVNFDDESKKFIKCLESKDIQACPGAGKTTSLVAKLDILANYMPFNDGSGILVLTHTNVAVDEIKKKLQDNVSKILNYPNFAGTFQSFIDKYFAIPMYVKIFGKKPERIDDETFYSKFQKELDNFKQYNINWIQQRANERNKTVIELIENSIVEEDYIQHNKKNLITSKSKMFPYIKRIFNLPYNLIANGYLKYSHCYDLAFLYLKKYPHISKVFQKRFIYVFIDEAQDTDNKQFEILNRLFGNSEVVIQKIGDNNQAIYSYEGQIENGWQVNENNKIEIKNTKRLSNEISAKVEKVAVTPQRLSGESRNIKPVIIIFKDENITKVLDIFIELIKYNNLHKKQRVIFKAVGAVHKRKNSGHTLPSYYPDYEIENNCFLQYKTLKDKLQNCLSLRLKPDEYKNIVLDIIKEYLKNEKILDNGEKYFTKRTILKYLKEYNEQIYNDFKFNLFKTTDKLTNKECILNELKETLSILLNLKNKTLNINLLNDIIKNYIYKKPKINSNTYKKENIEIEISTIHKVKGETHTATLVLDTFNRKYDAFDFVNHLTGKKLRLDVYKQRLLYVGMSRPTHLLCLAVHKKHKNNVINEKDIEFLKKEGFEVIEL